MNKLLALAAIAAVAVGGLGARAELVPTTMPKGPAYDGLQVAAAPVELPRINQRDRDRVAAFVAREDIALFMRAIGIDPTHVADRLPHLSDDNVALILSYVNRGSMGDGTAASLLSGILVACPPSASSC